MTLESERAHLLNAGCEEVDFDFWIPAQIISKGGESGEDKSGKRWIQGVASTSKTDLQQEIVAQNGIDFSYFLNHGYFNNDHKPGFENKVGQPTEAKITKSGLWVKGYLFKKHKVADEIWDLLTSLESSESDRKVGFSIQGKVLQRSGNKIEKCWIQDIAITPSPVNHHTWCEIAKSLSAKAWSFDDEKALAASGPLSVESLDEDVKEDRTSKSYLSFKETVALIKSADGSISEAAAHSIATVVFDMYGE